MSDKRSKRRVPIVLRIKLRYGDKGAFIDKFATNISRGGMFISTRKPKEVGSQISFELRLADSSTIIAGLGVVAWTRPFNPEAPRDVHGMGVEFTELADDSVAVIEEIVEYRRSLGLDDGYTIPQSPEPAPAPAPAPVEAADAEEGEPIEEALPTLEDAPRPSIPEVVAAAPTMPLDVARAVERARELAYDGDGGEDDAMLALLLRGEPADTIDLDSAAAVVQAARGDLSDSVARWDAALADLESGDS